MPTPRPAPTATRYDSRKILSLLVIPLYILVIALLDTLGGTATYPQPFALLLLNVAFLGVIPIYVAYVSVVSFRRSGLASLLMMGSGMLFIGLGAVAAGLVGLLPGAANLVVTVHNTSTCLGAALQFAGALTALVGWTVGPPDRRPSLAVAAYAVVAAMTAGLVLATLLGLTPTFFAPATGATVLRTLVLTGAIASLLVASVLFFVLYRKRREDFFFWYAIGMALIALGLIGVSFYSVFDDLLDWAARIEQYIGACFLLVAFLVLQRRATSGRVSAQEMLARFFGEAEAGYRQLIETAGDAITVLDPARRVLLWNAAAERMFGYSSDEAVGMQFSELVPAGAEEPPDGDAGQVHRETEGRRRDGRIIPIELAASRRSIDGEPITTCIIRDLSERKAAEAALRDSEERFRALYEHSRDAIVLSDPRDGGRILSANPAACRMLGWTEEELAGRSREALFDLDDPRTAALLEERNRTGSASAELLYRRHDGSTFPGEVNTALFTDSRGEVRSVAIIRDITERKRFEHALAESEADARSFMENLVDACAICETVCGADGTPVDIRLVDLNPALGRELGLPSSAIVGRTALELLPELAPFWFDRFLEVGRTGAAVEVEEPFPALGRWYRVVGFPVRGGRTAVLFRDITLRKQAEEALAESEERYRSLVENSIDAVLLTAPDGTVLAANAEACRIFGMTEEELILGGRDAVVDLSDPRLGPALEERQRTGRFKGELRYRRKDGTVFPGEVATALFTDPNGAVLTTMIVRDVTERKEAEAALHEYAERLRTSNEELQRFAYVASHDLQEPLRSIVSFSQLLERRYKGKLDADADDFIEFIVEGGIRMQTLIQDLLQVSRIETGAKPLAPTDAGAVVNGALRALEAPIREADAIVTVEALPGVMADSSQLEQVFVNLIGNAIKYRRPEIPPEIRIEGRRVGPMVQFSVQDNGIGIEPEYFDRIFEMFRRLHTHDEYGGTGIGLAVVKKIVERHGGKVWVESTPGEGSTFFFTLPAA